jgi:hypothetical protein
MGQNDEGDDEGDDMIVFKPSYAAHSHSDHMLNADSYAAGTYRSI